MKLSKRSEYGIKAAVRLCLAHGSGYLQSREIAEKEQLPAKFLESILLALRSAGLLESKVGAGGGYRLTRSPDEILVAELIGVLEDEDDALFNPGGVGRPGHISLCIVYERLNGAITDELNGLTLSELTALAGSDSGVRSGTGFVI